MKVVLDADVIIGALDASDPQHPLARKRFLEWRDQGVERMVSVVNLSEVLVAPAADARSLRAAREAISALDIVVHYPGELIGVEAAQLRSRHPISLPDAFCIATAHQTQSAVFSFDRQIIRVAKAEKITITAE